MSNHELKGVFIKMDSITRGMYITWIVFIVLAFSSLMINFNSDGETSLIVPLIVFIGLAILGLIEGIMKINQNKKRYGAIEIMLAILLFIVIMIAIITS